MKKEIWMAVGALVMILVSIPTQLVILALVPGIWGVLWCICIALMGGAAGSYLVYMGFDTTDLIRDRKGAKVGP